MDLNLNDIVQKFKPWDFTITFDGVTYQTRAFTLADAQELTNAPGVPDLRGKLKTMFVGQAPPVETWEDELVVATLRGFSAYKESITSKNSQAAVDAVAAALMTKSPIVGK